MLAVALLGGAVAFAFALAVAYYGTMVALATGVDPDNYGIPLVTASAASAASSPSSPPSPRWA
jgi:cation transporter-like permease